MKKDNCAIKSLEWGKKKVKKSNYSTYLILLVFFTALLLLSLFFNTAEKPFTIFSSFGCGGIASVVVAWLVEISNNRISIFRNQTIITQLLFGFDSYVTMECQRAIVHCARTQEMDIDKSYSIPEICTMLDKVCSKDIYFRGFPDVIQKGLNGVTELTILSFDQTEIGSTLYDLFLALRSTLQTMSQISEIDDSEEMIKIMVIDCFDFINQINITRGKKCTYQILDDSKQYINRVKVDFKKE